MPRTTLNIDAAVLKDLKRLEKSEGKSLGRLVSELLAWALRSREAGVAQSARFTWISRPMEARLNLADRDAVWSGLDRSEGSGSHS